MVILLVALPLGYAIHLDHPVDGIGYEWWGPLGGVVLSASAWLLWRRNSRDAALVFGMFAALTVLITAAGWWWSEAGEGAAWLTVGVASALGCGLCVRTLWRVTRPDWGTPNPLQRETGIRRPPEREGIQVWVDPLELTLGPGEKLYVSTGNLAVFSSEVQYGVRSVGGCRKMFFGGEGLFMTEMTGPGWVMLQSLKKLPMVKGQQAAG